MTRLKEDVTRKHSSRMCTIRLEAICASVAKTNGESQVNKFEQVSSGGHQMPLAWDPCCGRLGSRKFNVPEEGVPGLMLRQGEITVRSDQSLGGGV